MNRECLNCGKLFSIKNKIFFKLTKFCSSKCRGSNWKKLNREKDLLLRRQYNAKRKLNLVAHERDKEIRKKWRQSNKDKKYSYKRAYRARKYGNGGKHSKDDWEAIKYAYDFICQMCGLREPEIKLTEDHFIPLTRQGTDDIENIQPLCQPCNSTKSNIEDNSPQFKPQSNFL